MNRIFGIAILLAILTAEVVGLLQWIVPVDRSAEDVQPTLISVLGRS